MKKILIAALLAMAFAPALGADKELDAKSQLAPGMAIVNLAPGEDNKLLINVRQLQMSRKPGKLIKNAPYSAEVVNEQVQTLADGNQIVTRSSSMSYRDSLGRTRQELSDTNGEARHVAINANGVAYMINPQNKSATRIVGLTTFGTATAEAAGANSEPLNAAGQTAAGGSDGDAVMIKDVERSTADGKKKFKEDLLIVVPTSKDSAGAHDARIGARLGAALMIAGAFGDTKWSAKAVTKDLGSKDFEGIKADGKLRSYDIPAGEVGNKKTITVSDETWYAPDL